MHGPLPVYAEVDPRRVERIVRNLVANAVDHGEGRPVLIEIGCDEHTVAVLVRDHGRTAPSEAGAGVQPVLAGRGVAARRSGAAARPSLAVEDARLHGGWLQAWGELGHGAAFRLTLPRSVGTTVESSLRCRSAPAQDPAPAKLVPVPTPTPPRGRPAVAAQPAWTEGVEG